MTAITASDSGPQDNASGDSIPTIESIQWLRFIAASLVVIFHTEVQLSRFDSSRHHEFGIGASGVDLFFVISGFIMVYITYGRRDNFSSFMLRRVFRIVPIYWVSTFVLLTLLLVAPTVLHSTKLDLAHVVSSFMFLPYPHPVLELQRPLLVPGWTLNYEMFFYVVFGSVLWLPLGARILAVGSALASLVLAQSCFAGGSRWLDFYGSPIVLEFVVGMAIAWLYFTRARLSIFEIASVAGFGFLMFAAGVWAGINEQDSRVIFWGFGSAGVVLAFVFAEKAYGCPRIRLLRHLGDASYSIYLSHLFVLALISGAISQLGVFPWLGESGTRAVMLTGAICAGSAIFLWVERPMQKTLKKWVEARRCAGSAGSTRSGGQSTSGLLAPCETNGLPMSTDVGSDNQKHDP